MKEIRELKPSEISVFPRRVTGNTAYLLLYKDARVDMAILDETYGKMGWKRTHKELGRSLFCTVSVYDKETGEWVEKEDLGVESNIEAEKGRASDAFKRACYNWGIGRELYTAPNIAVDITNSDLNASRKLKTSFFVSEIGYDKGAISRLVIVDGYGRVRFTWGEGDPMGNLPEGDPEADLTKYRVETEARLMAYDFPEDRKQKSLAGVMSYDKKTLDAVNKAIDEGRL